MQKCLKKINWELHPENHSNDGDLHKFKWILKETENVKTWVIKPINKQKIEDIIKRIDPNWNIA